MYNIDLSLDYGNFTIELDNQELVRRNGYYLGVKSGVSYNIFASMYILFGYRFIGRMDSYNFGLENYPYMGLSYRITTRKG